MRRFRQFVAAVGLAAIVLGAAAPAAMADSKHKCSPGQHGNPKPGFKPGSCDN